MTIAATPRRSPVYTGNGVATTYAFAFKVLDAATVVVTVADENDLNSSVLVNGVDYTVTLNADQDASPGGEIAYASLPVGHRLVITTDTDYSQPTAITNLGAFHAHVLEGALDRIVIQQQQQEEKLARTLQVPVTSETDPTAYLQDSLTTAANSAAAAAASADAAAAKAAEAQALFTSTGANLVGFTPAGVGAVSRTVQAKLRDVVSVKDFGAVGDGVTDDTAAIQAAIDSLGATGGVVLFPFGTYVVGSSIEVTSVEQLKIQAHGATFKEVGASLTSLFYFTSCDWLEWDGGAFEADEDQAYFVANTPSEIRAFLKVYSCGRPVVRNIRGKHKRRLIHVDGCTAPVVENYYHEGWMQAASLGAETGANNAPAVTIRGGYFGLVQNGYVKNHGSALLLQNTSEKVTVWGVRGSDLHDNGVYGSSCEEAVVTGCVFDEIIGDGVKLRGGKVSAIGNVVSGAQARGVVLTPLDVGTADSLGAVSASLLISGNVATGCGIGVAALVVSGSLTTARSVSVVGNVIRDTTISGASGAGVSVTVDSSEVIVSDNLVTDVAGDYGIFIGSSGAGETVSRVVASGNMVSRVTGSVSSVRGGLTIMRAENLTVSGNQFNGISSTHGVRLYEVAGALVQGNCYEGGQVLRAQNGENNSGIVAVNNRGASLSLQSDARETVARNFTSDGGAGTVLYGETTYDPPSLAAGSSTTTAITVTGAALGDIVQPSFSLDLSNLSISGYVSAANTVRVTFSNLTGAAVDLASGVLRVRVEKPAF